MESVFGKVTVSEKAEKSLRAGHPWVYGEEITSDTAGITNGDAVNVFSGKGRYLGTGFFNSCSKITVRIFSTNLNDKIDYEFWKRRVAHALDYRRSVMGDDFVCCRLIFGEADYFPGLTVDRFGDVLSVQILSLCMDKLRGTVIPLIIDNLREHGEKVSVVYERSASPIRALEGLKNHEGFFDYDGLTENSSAVRISENGILFDVDFMEGQKTGFFLDQKYNRRAVASIARGKRVLDCFTHTGAFALNCARAGAESVTAVDVSADAVEMASHNAKINGLDVNFVCADVFEYLDSCKKGDFDLIILDPPAFTKSRDTVRNAVKGYTEINTKAMRLLGRGGYLATCSCSHFMTDTFFKQMIHNSAADCGFSLKQIEARHQSPDHPILWNVPETEYLKFFIFQIV